MVSDLDVARRDLGGFGPALGGSETKENGGKIGDETQFGRRIAVREETRCPAQPFIPCCRRPVRPGQVNLSLIHISEPTRLGMISYAVFCLKKTKMKKLSTACDT